MRCERWTVKEYCRHDEGHLEDGAYAREVEHAAVRETAAAATAAAAAAARRRLHQLACMIQHVPRENLSNDR
jgi:hypothetical protein